MTPLRILHVTPSFYPATWYGGPVFSTYALSNALAADPRVELRVLTTDTAGPKASQRLSVESFPTLYPPGYPVFFTRRLLGKSLSPGLLARLWSMIGWADVVQLTAIYSSPTIPTLAIARLRHRPVLWSPRGGLLASHTWDGAPRQRLKRAWERMCRAVAPERTLLHVTSEKEKAASEARLPGIRAIVIPNGIDIPPAAPSRRWQPDGVLRLMFIGRIDPVKAIENLIEALTLLEPGSVRLDVYGTGLAEYVDSLKHLAAGRGLGDVVRFRGQVEGEGKRQAFAEADTCVLPSFSENFSMVVAEALAHGVPAIVSRGAPWPDLERRRSGRWVDNSPASLAAAIRSMRQEDLAAMGAAGRQWMEADFNWRQMAARTFDAMKALCETAPGGDAARAAGISRAPSA